MLYDDDDDDDDTTSEEGQRMYKLQCGNNKDKVSIIYQTAISDYFIITYHWKLSTSKNFLSNLYLMKNKVANFILWTIN